MKKKNKYKELEMKRQKSKKPETDDPNT